jgi:hypothetical protein
MKGNAIDVNYVSSVKLDEVSVSFVFVKGEVLSQE